MLNTFSSVPGWKNHDVDGFDGGIARQETDGTPPVGASGVPTQPPTVTGAQAPATYTRTGRRHLDARPAAVQAGDAAGGRR
ncbi:hypothetical protein BM536_038555 [Streptomyces phaeoluteigriseus]|uniref:Uncharacterized protein n=1 Tax=Streptomyces phaeoluteigriseus TaxID=114686 RepID=A0A1V6MHG2_9ACTN|nr:hypothetical protein [Streptomyces phaeoluteigriseus]OQD51712.1 hypothetical protein BM536_038555 [Streptomyces phaeoluteigriseus]